MNKEQSIQKEGLLMVISAPSGAGKTTLCHRLINRFPELEESVSYTTRPPRNGEQNGVDYHFVSEERFRQMVADNDFAEWAEVHGNYYGTAISTLKDAKKNGVDILLDIDCQGARILKDSGVSGLFVFVLPPSMKELRRRLETRSSDQQDVIERRIARAAEEIKESRWYDYIIVNDNLDEAADSLAAIVTAARLTRRQMFENVAKLFDI